MDKTPFQVLQDQLKFYRGLFILLAMVAALAIHMTAGLYRSNQHLKERLADPDARYLRGVLVGECACHLTVFGTLGEDCVSVKAEVEALLNRIRK